MDKSSQESKNRIKRWKGINILILIVSLFILFYMIGHVIAKEKSKPFIEAISIIYEAEGPVMREWKAATNNNDSTKAFEFEKKYSDLYARASQITLDDYPDLKEYVNQTNLLQKEYLEYDEKVISGESQVSEEESNTLNEKYIDRKSTIIERYGFCVNPSNWMKFFLVKTPENTLNVESL